MDEFAIRVQTHLRDYTVLAKLCVVEAALITTLTAVFAFGAVPHIFPAPHRMVVLTHSTTSTSDAMRTLLVE